MHFQHFHNAKCTIPWLRQASLPIYLYIVFEKNILSSFQEKIGFCHLSSVYRLNDKKTASQ